MKIIHFLIAVLLAGGLSSCYYDKEELLYGNTGASCSAAAGTISYSQQVVPLLNSQCYSCHSGGSPSGNILMGTYNADKAIGLNGKLYGSINHSSGYKPMPEGAPRMTDCQIAIIKKWIDQGSPDN
jgi:mono/diheme cytochrome c family protein